MLLPNTYVTRGEAHRANIHYVTYHCWTLHRYVLGTPPPPRSADADRLHRNLDDTRCQNGSKPTCRSMSTENYPAACMCSVDWLYRKIKSKEFIEMLHSELNYYSRQQHTDSNRIWQFKSPPLLV